MITADFNGETYTKVYGLWQWDTGRRLKIIGIPITEDIVEVHFAIDGSKEADRSLGKAEGGAIIADIPNVLLQAGKNLIAYIYITTETEGFTVCKAYIYVKPRAKPKDYEEPEHEELLRQLLNEIKKKGDGLQLTGSELQLLSGETPVGNKVQISGGGTGDITSITIPEIDEIMKGE